MHTADEMGIDDFQASRSPHKRYRTAPLKDSGPTRRGGFSHNGRFATLLDVVEHYNTFFHRGLPERKGDPGRRKLTQREPHAPFPSRARLNTTTCSPPVCGPLRH